MKFSFIQHPILIEVCSSHLLTLQLQKNKQKTYPEYYIMEGISLTSCVFVCVCVCGVCVCVRACVKQLISSTSIYVYVCVCETTGRFYKCVNSTTGETMSSSVVPNKSYCLQIGQTWQNSKIHFDNSAAGFLALFQVVSP